MRVIENPAARRPLPLIFTAPGGDDELAREAITGRNSCLSKKLPIISMSRTGRMSRMGQFSRTPAAVSATLPVSRLLSDALCKFGYPIV